MEDALLTPCERLNIATKMNTNRQLQINELRLTRKPLTQPLMIARTVMARLSGQGIRCCFDGDVAASDVDNFRLEISAILTMATSKDEVVVCLESPGGMVHSYGLAASQMMRVRNQNIPLTAVVDKVAASGGYLMAAVANKIVAAPFAVIGSIGVVAQVPNTTSSVEEK